MALRYLFLTSHYRHELNFTWESLAAAQSAYDRLLRHLALFAQEPEQSMVQQEQLQKADQLRQKFLEAVNDDLNFPEALAVINQILKLNLTGRQRYDLIIDLDDTGRNTFLIRVYGRIRFDDLFPGYTMDTYDIINVECDVQVIEVCDDK